LLIAGYPAKTESLGARGVPFREVYSLPEAFLLRVTVGSLLEVGFWVLGCQKTGLSDYSCANIE